MIVELEGVTEHLGVQADLFREFFDGLTGVRDFGVQKFGVVVVIVIDD